MPRLRVWFSLVLLGLLAPLWFVAKQWREERDWHLWAQGSLVAVHVERSLYAIPRNDDFLAHVRVTNQTNRTLKVNLHPLTDPIHPSIAFRGSSIAGRHAVKPTTFTAFGRQQQAQLRHINRFPSRLIAISAGKSLDYFINAKQPRARLASSLWGAANSRLGVFMSGSLPVTDGRSVEVITDDTGVETTGGIRYSNGGVSILSPGEWNPLPHGARVLRR